MKNWLPLVFGPALAMASVPHVFPGHWLVVEAIAGAAGAGAGWIACLRHEVGNNAMERHPIVETLARQEDEVVDGVRRILGIQIGFHRAEACVQGGGVRL